MKNIARKQKRKQNETAKILPFPNQKAIDADDEFDLVDLNEIVTGGENGFSCYPANNCCGVIAAGDFVVINNSRKARIGDYIFDNGQVTIMNHADVAGNLVAGFLRKFKEVA